MAYWCVVEESSSEGADGRERSSRDFSLIRRASRRGVQPERRREIDR